ncbi:hypothetical protein [Parabacteroides bouchesdurhonensis]|uniref:hypothetical protein n=1 Tax=Parabacteroides bouchesdurhonensis TaxID=1936995 RepID=UPI000E4F68DE|nr:hypothetical protein [Parabacteroides bouchesdurhonensis]RHJ92920.1 hypothetical protein DW095_06040 [Bacteroides sp. AM07-16]
MKTNVMKFMYVVFCMFICTMVSAQNSEKPTGNWEFSASDAPYGYQEGTCFFKAKNGKLTATVKVSGRELKIDDIKAQDNTDMYKCQFYLDGASVELSFKFSDNKITNGLANAEGMSIPVTFKKIISETSKSGKKK